MARDNPPAGALRPLSGSDAESATAPSDVQVIDEPALPARAKTGGNPAGRTRAGRLARRFTGGPGTPVFEAAVSVRSVGYRLAARGVALRGRVRPLPGAVREGCVAIRVHGHPVQARLDPDATPLAEQHRLIGVVGAALAAEGVDYFVVPGPRDFFTIGVPGRSRGQLHDALLAVAQQEDLLVAPVDPNRPPAYRPYPAEQFGTDVRQLSLWCPVVAGDRRSLLGPHSRVTIQIWEQGKGSVLRAPVENRYAQSMTRSSQGEKVAIQVGEGRQPAFPEMAVPHVDDVTFPIDLVYTWVDGTDPAWRARMVTARERLDLPVPESALHDARFLSLDELRYSIRSAVAFAPWFRRIYLVTDHQVPPWLDASDPRIVVVSHEEIWSDRTQLPVFNSHAIESRLHHIPGLAEHYVYLNDDVFFGRMTYPHAFFSPGGLIRFFASPTRIGLGDRALDEPAGSTAAKNDRRILLGATGAIQTQRLKHTAHPQRRSVALELEERFEDVYRRTAGSVFRSPLDISPIALQTWYAYRTGRAMPGSARYAYVGVSSREQLHRLDELRGGTFSMFCLNQSEEETVEQAVMTRALGAFLEEYYPFRSKFERPG